MKNIKDYETAGEWFLDARSKGYSVSGIMCNELNLAQRELGLSFAEVFELFIKYKIIIKAGYCYLYLEMGRLAIKDYKKYSKKINKML